MCQCTYCVGRSATYFVVTKKRSSLRFKLGLNLSFGAFRIYRDFWFWINQTKQKQQSQGDDLAQEKTKWRRMSECSQETPGYVSVMFWQRNDQHWSGEPVYFSWTNRRKTTTWGWQENTQIQRDQKWKCCPLTCHSPWSSCSPFSFHWFATMFSIILSCNKYTSNSIHLLITNIVFFIISLKTCNPLHVV